jgi:prepilin-type N-terminal cleavage/methylation domain-containing protein
MSRRGFTLIELLAVLTIGAVVTGVCVGALHLLLRTERKSRNHVPESQAIARLAEQFRDDVNAAIEAKSSGQNSSRFAFGNDRFVEYQAQPGELRRREIVAGKVVRQEEFVLPEDCATVISFDAHTARLAIQKQNDATERELQVVAGLGKDHRFNKAGGDRHE